MKKLPLSQGRFVIIDDEDFEKFGHFKWSAQMKPDGTFYATRNVGKKPNQKTIYLHCEIMGAKGIDHIDGNRGDCRRENLRPATNQQNQQGFKRKRLGASGQFRGVSWDTSTQKWCAQIQTGGKVCYLGLFDHEDAAAWAYDAIAKSKGFFKEALNFPNEV